jgi:hypothetical protein
MSRVKVYKEGLCAVSVCADKGMTKEEVAEEVNALNSTGIGSQWSVTDETFATGEPNPCPCNDDPENKEHWVLHC